MNCKFLLIICIPFSMAATSAPASSQPSMPILLLDQYNYLIKEMREPTTVPNPELNNAVTDLVSQLRDRGNCWEPEIRVLIKQFEKLEKKAKNGAINDLLDAIHRDTDPVTRAAKLVQLAELYYWEKPQNYTRAWKYFMQAAEQNANPYAKAAAQEWLGEFYYMGLGVDEDEAIALRYFEDAAAQDVNPNARAFSQWRIGEIYYHGRAGVEPNFATAREYLMLAANQKFSLEARIRSEGMLGRLYFSGLGLDEPDFVNARKYFQLASQQKLDYVVRADSQFHLGLIFFYGLGFPKDNARAELYLGRVAIQEAVPSLRKSAWKYLIQLEERRELEALEKEEIKRRRAAMMRPPIQEMSFKKPRKEESE